MAMLGGNFGQQNVRDRLEPQNITFPPAEAMTAKRRSSASSPARRSRPAFRQRRSPATSADTSWTSTRGDLLGTSSAAREEGLDADTAADLQGKADTLFKGESLRAMLLNAYGWWTVATIALWAGVAMVIAGLLMGSFLILGFRHARRSLSRPPSLGRREEGLVGSTV